MRVTSSVIAAVTDVTANVGGQARRSSLAGAIRSSPPCTALSEP
jgi:hypothetical protein